MKNSVAIVTGASQGIGRSTAARPQHERGRGNEEVSRRGRHQPLRPTGGDCRAFGINGLACCKVDDSASVRMDGGEVKGI
jgi:NAD(P)-dependent dehydrogenase (short-subunit alcohol dehydrogenase family)